MAEAETGLIKLDDFTQALAEAKTIPEVKNLRDQAATFKEWLKRRGANRLEKNAIAELQIRAERKLGAMLDAIIPHEGGRPNQKRLDELTVLSQMDISKFQSHWWQQLYNIPEYILTEYVAGNKRNYYHYFMCVLMVKIKASDGKSKGARKTRWEAEETAREQGKHVGRPRKQ